MVFLVACQQIGAVQVGLPAQVAIGHEVDHVPTSERRLRFDIGGMHLQQFAKVFAAGARAKELAAVIARS